MACACKVALGLTFILIITLEITIAQDIPVNVVVPNIIVPGPDPRAFVPVPGDFFAYPRYQYGYGVNDRATGDTKTASEHRDGHVVRGEYLLREPDGGIRHVTYVADLGGFRANVQRTPGAPGVAVGPAVVPVVRPAVVPVAVAAI